ncbi:MAG: TIGR03087 family PEP-CTERM/XrtA system glycosyltransferase [Steroidobacteraceae bacterium]
MKVLFVCHRVPFPPKRGGKIRPFNIIRHLTSRGHRVTVASLARDARELEEARGLGEHCERVCIETVPTAAAWARMIARLPTSHPSSFGYFHSPQLGRRVRAELATGAYELVFVHCSSVAGYVARVHGAGARVDAEGAREALRILDFGDMDSQKWREYVRYKPLPLSAGYWLEAVKLERAEARLAGRFDLCTCTTRAELDSLRALGADTRSDWFPNGVDGAYFQPTADYDPGLVVFVGRMDYYPNQQAVLEFCREVLPPLRRDRPTVRFEIVGADPPQSIRDLGRLPGVTVTGSVADVRPHVARAALTVAPLTIARGTQNKILESMALGVPVVCSVAASRGVDAVAGEHLLIASGTGQYTAAIRQILESPVLRERLARAGRERVLTHHAWERSMARLDQLIETALERRMQVRSSQAYAVS